MEQTVLYAFALIFYGASAGLAWRDLKPPSAAWGKPLRFTLLLLALLLHALAWHDQVFTSEGLRFGFAHVVSISCWLVAAVSGLESLQNDVLILELFAYPVAAVAAWLPHVLPGALAGHYVDSLWFKLHIAIAIGAYSLMTIAAAHAILMSMQEKSLHSPVGRWSGGGGGHSAASGPRWVESLPPLLVMERVLFRMILLGFVMLTLTLASGIVFSEQWYHKPMRFDHKTVFACVSWAIFAALLCGRYVYGWRGKTALRWTMWGFGTLVLAYVGSRFVLEVVLHRIA